MADKYSNGMYKTTTKKQDAVAQKLFHAVQVQTPGATMGEQFNQVSGMTELFFYNGSDLIFTITVERNGNILR